MSVERIDPGLCTGCGTCVLCCPCDVIRMDETGNLAVIKYVEDCMCCDACENDCPTGAIYVSPEKYQPLTVSWC